MSSRPPCTKLSTRTRRPGVSIGSHVALAALAAAGLLGCGDGSGASGDATPAVDSAADLSGGAAWRRAPQPQAVSLLGDTLYASALPPDALADRLARLAEARAAYEEDPDDPDAIIWLGRRLAYLGQYREAIDVYGEGIENHPEEPRLYRHRGHRLITTRRLDRAVEDLERAAALIEGTEDEVEPDGLPNARGIPTSTLHSNVWYHLGLARYLQGDFEGALEAYRRCLDVSRNPDMLVATANWLYMTLRRLGRDAEAARVLEPITADLDVIENDSYHRLLLLYRGDATPESLWEDESEALGNATVGYGVGNWHLYNGRTDEAEGAFRRVLETREWAAFGYL
ncbi:MAG: tetratricopeptide repeat protein, partial [Gemmatimonadota bacterium]